jgi:hypothetical protein
LRPPYALAFLPPSRRVATGQPPLYLRARGRWSGCHDNWHADRSHPDPWSRQHFAGG